jgi:hypothetical protein
MMLPWHLSVGFHEEGINTLLGHLKAQRPSLFNSATKAIADSPGFLCVPIPKPSNGAPTLLIVPPMVLREDKFGKLALNYCFQIKQIGFDCYPGAGVDQQTFSISIEACLGIGLSSSIPDEVLRFPDSVPSAGDYVLPIDRMLCHCVEMTVIGTGRWVRKRAANFLFPSAKKVVFDGITPPDLHDLIAGYTTAMLNSNILPGMATKLEELVLAVGDKKVKFGMSPSAISPNPDISNDSLSAFVTLE